MPTDEQRNWVDRPQKSPTEWRKYIRRRLRKLVPVNDADMDFREENSEHAEWLKTHVRPRFWEKFQLLAKEHDEKIARERQGTVTDMNPSQEETGSPESLSKDESPAQLDPVEQFHWIILPNLSFYMHTTLSSLRLCQMTVSPAERH